MKKLQLLIIILLSVFLAGCSDKKDEPQPTANSLMGYWAITHIKTIEHTGGLHSTSDKDVPPHGVDSYATDVNYRYDVLIFDEDLVTVRGDMPNRPKHNDYEDSLEGLIQFQEELDSWYNSIGHYTDQFECPVGTYCIKNDDLIIGALNMGRLNFTSADEFTLDYKKSIGTSDDYKRSVYTYSRIYSLIFP